jgi:hypothetical protein
MRLFDRFELRQKIRMAIQHFLIFQNLLHYKDSSLLKNIDLIKYKEGVYSINDGLIQRRFFTFRKILLAQLNTLIHNIQRIELNQSIYSRNNQGNYEFT